MIKFALTPTRELDSAGPDVEPGTIWTLDPVPQPAWAPVYLGGTVDPETLEVIGGAWEDPNAPVVDPNADLNNAKAQAYIINNDAYASATLAITDGYPDLEKDTWPTQDREIKAWQLNNDASTPWIDTAAAIRGLDRLVYIQKTLTKIAQFEQASAFLTGLRQRYEDQIKAATQITQIEAIVYNYSFSQ